MEHLGNEAPSAPTVRHQSQIDYSTFKHPFWKLESEVSQKGNPKYQQTLVLRAQIDCIVAMSACPQDILPINGAACQPTEAHYRILPRRP